MQINIKFRDSVKDNKSVGGDINIELIGTDKLIEKVVDLLVTITEKISNIKVK